MGVHYGVRPQGNAILLFYGNGNSLAGWDNHGITISSTTGNPVNSFSSTGGNQYADISPVGITSFVGKTIMIDMYATGGVPLVDFYFGCNSSGAGQHARLDTRGGGNWTGFAPTVSWTSWSAPISGTTSLSTNVWYTFKIQINSTASNGMSLYINNVFLVNGTFVDNGAYIGMQGDGGNGGNWDNIRIYDRIF